MTSNGINIYNSNAIVVSVLIFEPLSVSSLSNSTATITSRTSSCGTAVTTATTNKLETTFNIIDEVIDNEQGTYI